MKLGFEFDKNHKIGVVSQENWFGRNSNRKKHDQNLFETILTIYAHTYVVFQGLFDRKNPDFCHGVSALIHLLITKNFVLLYT